MGENSSNFECSLYKIGILASIASLPLIHDPMEKDQIEMRIFLCIHAARLATQKKFCDEFIPSFFINVNARMFFQYNKTLFLNYY